MRYIAKPIEVTAWPIIKVSENEGPGLGQRFITLSDGQLIAISGQLAPSVGDYVVQDGGQLNIAPRAFFESKYELVTVTQNTFDDPFDWDATRGAKA